MERQQLVELENVFRQLARRVSHHWGKHLEDGMSHSQASILEKLKDHGPQKVSDLAEQLSMTSGAITGIADKLISSGYAVRKRSETDRRVVYIEISPQGIEILLKLRKQMGEIFSHLFSGVSEEDIVHLIRIYNQVLNNMEQADTKEE